MTIIGGDARSNGKAVNTRQQPTMEVADGGRRRYDPSLSSISLTDDDNDDDDE